MINHGNEEAEAAAEWCVAAKLRPIWRGFRPPENPSPVWGKREVPAILSCWGSARAPH
jgi:hypothetical protein